jgi:hypothetical protein
MTTLRGSGRYCRPVSLHQVGAVTFSFGAEANELLQIARSRVLSEDKFLELKRSFVRTTLTPRDVVPEVEVFGQHEISELTKSREKLTLLVERDPAAGAPTAKLRADLERSHAKIIDAQQQIKHIDERLALLPSLEETQKRYQRFAISASCERALVAAVARSECAHRPRVTGNCIAFA